jgi:hypothetical protein
MQNRKICRWLSRSVLVLVLTAIAAPAAQARHAPARAELGTSPLGDVDGATRHHHPDVVQPPTRIVTVPRADSFDWSAAGIGAAGALGAALVIGGSTLLLRRNKRAITADRQKGVPAV